MLLLLLLRRARLERLDPRDHRRGLRAPGRRLRVQRRVGVLEVGDLVVVDLACLGRRRALRLLHERRRRRVLARLRHELRRRRRGREGAPVRVRARHGVLVGAVGAVVLLLRRSVVLLLLVRGGGVLLRARRVAARVVRVLLHVLLVLRVLHLLLRPHLVLRMLVRVLLLLRRVLPPVLRGVCVHH